MRHSDFVVKRLLLIVLLLTMGVTHAFSIDISGTVTDSVSLTPIEGVVVKAMDGKKALAFTTTNTLGAYKLTVENPPGTFAITFQHLSYSGKTQPVTDKTRQTNASLSSKTTMLREASVRAPEVLVKKDTVSYNVASFTTDADRTIEDVLKKLPGIEISDDGAIKYLGKDLSQFSIEGLDALGGKYALATRNLEAKDVNRVEMIENFQKKKMFQGKKTSEAVAMNLTLNEAAKMKLIGTQEVGVGVREKNLLYHGGVTGMVFNKKNQFIGTLKANNWGKPLTEEISYHYGMSSNSNTADGLISENLAASPPLSYSLYHQKNELMSSLNTIFKLTEDNSLRVNVDYLRDRNQYRYETVSTYYLNNNATTITEKQAPEYSMDLVRASLNYERNSSTKYFQNATHVEVKRVDNAFQLTNNNANILQTVTSSLSSISNDLEFHKQIGKKDYRILSGIAYSQLPEKRLTFTGVEGQTGDFYQLSKGETVFTNNGTSLNYTFKPGSSLSIWLGAMAKYDRIYTRLQRGDSSILNRNDGFKIDFSASPLYRLQAADKRYDLDVSMPIHNYYLIFKNRVSSDADFYLNQVFLSPTLTATYRFSASSKMNVTGGISNDIGDITNFIVNPIQVDYKQTTSQSGILAKNQRASVGLSMMYQKPMDLFSSNGSVSYNHNRRNILNGQTLTVDSTGVGIGSAGVSDDNTSQGISISGAVEKGIRPISTKIALRASYSSSTSQQLRQGVKIDINSNYLSLSPRVETRIAKKITINYSLQYGASGVYGTNLSSKRHQQQHYMRMEYNLFSGMYVYCTMNYNRTEITSGVYKTMKQVDALMFYRHKQFEAELHLNNLLNLKQYSQTTLDNLDSYTYTYYLNPREAVVIFRFSL